MRPGRLAPVTQSMLASPGHRRLAFAGGTALASLGPGRIGPHASGTTAPRGSGRIVPRRSGRTAPRGSARPARVGPGGPALGPPLGCLRRVPTRGHRRVGTARGGRLRGPWIDGRRSPRPLSRPCRRPRAPLGGRPRLAFATARRLRCPTSGTRGDGTGGLVGPSRPSRAFRHRSGGAARRSDAQTRDQQQRQGDVGSGTQPLRLGPASVPGTPTHIPGTERHLDRGRNGNCGSAYLTPDSPSTGTFPTALWVLPLQSIRQSTEHPFAISIPLARPRGFEPLTFGSVDRADENDA